MVTIKRSKQLDAFFHRSALWRWLVLGIFAGFNLVIWGNATPTDHTAKLAPDLTFLLQRSVHIQQEGQLDLDLFEGFDQTAFESLAERPSTGVLIRTRSVDALRQRGIEIHTVLGDIVTARISLEQLAALAAWPEVLYVEGAGGLSWMQEPVASFLPELDQSVRQSGASRLHGQGITGKGVVIGVVDTGVDWQHLDFRIDRDGDGFEEGSRLLGIWDQTVPGNRPSGFGYGVEYAQTEIEQALATNDSSLIKHFDANPNAPSHGSHALGIVGGDGSSSSLRLVGMAPGAELIMVKSPLNAAAVIDGVNYIFNVAGDRPAVANLSLGGHLGAHDGTSNFERALDALAQGPGRVIVVSAGNDGDDLIHVGGELAATATVSFTFDLLGPLEKSRFSFDFWYDANDPIEVRVIGPNGEVLGPVTTGTSADESLPMGGVFVDNAQNGPNPNNGLNELLINVYGKLLGAKHPLQPGRWIIELHAPRLGTRFDGWALDTPFTSSNANNHSTVTIPATARKIISVGAYVSRTTWLGFDNARHAFTDDNALGQIAAFSSLGPTRDGRVKPDLVAPGSMIAATLASASLNLVKFSNILSDGLHYVNRGTSFSAPHVSGAAALLLQLHPEWTAVQVLRQLKQMALLDEFTGFVANNVWGSGKLGLDLEASPAANPFLAVANALDADGDDFIGDEEIVLAVQFWITGDTLPSADDQPITDSIIQWLIGIWIQEMQLNNVVGQAVTARNDV